MKNLLYILLVLPLVIVGQSTDQNYVKNTIYTKEYSISETATPSNIPENHKIETVTYYDGLGRPIQSVNQRAGGNKEDIISYFEYDNLGRQIKEYLPYAEITNNGDFRSDAFNGIASFYNTSKYENTLNPFAEKFVESSPLNRVFEQAAPGEDWKMANNHTIKLDYQTNSTNEVLMFDVKFTNDDFENPELLYIQNYLQNSLLKNIVKDENWVVSDGTNRTKEEFKDKLGRVVLSRAYADINGVSTSHDTYYIYDDFGNLSFVIPPLAVDRILDSNNDVIAVELDNLCYQYKYDERNRIVEKKIPGKGWEFIIYDNLNRPVLTQDALLRSYGQWLFTKYDALNRIAYTGVLNDVDSRINMQDRAYTDSAINHESRISSPILIDGTESYYSNSAFPNENGALDILTVNYYDDYSWSPTAGIEASYNFTNVSPAQNVRVTASAGIAKINGSDNLYDSGFLTESEIQGDGYIQYTINEDDKRAIIGLSNITIDTNEDYLEEDYTSIDHAILTGTSTKKVYIYEEGVSITPPTTYANNGDVFKIERLGSQIVYKKNGDIFYVSSSESIGVLKGDGSLRNIGTAATSIHIGHSAFGQELNNNVIGLLTGSFAKELPSFTENSGSIWETSSTFYYDEKGSSIQMNHTITSLSTSEVITSKLGFDGKVLEAHSTHIKDDGIPAFETTNNVIVTEDLFLYDHANRLLEHQKQINSGGTETIVLNEYDELGQLSRKNVGGTIPNLSTYNNHSPVEISITNNTITKQTGGSSWNHGVSTVETISSDGIVRVKINQTGRTLKFGLNDSSVSASSTIDFAISLQFNGKVRIYEGSTNLGDKSTYLPNDVFSVKRTGTKIEYIKNNEVFYTSLATSVSTSLRGDIYFYHEDSSIQNFVVINSGMGLQNVDYAYNIRGWLKNINEDAISDNDLFNFTLMYNNPTSGTALFNGNISQTSWNTLNTDKSIKTYTYEYDALNRIISGESNDDKFNLVFTGYDKNGNILELKRNGHIVLNPDLAVPADFGVMDNLNYSYTGNQLTKVDDLGNSTYGFKDGVNTGDDYSYDVNGNMKKDKNKGITDIQYNHLNLPTQVTFYDNDINIPGAGIIAFRYDANGVKINKGESYPNLSETVNGQGYSGSFIYSKSSGNAPYVLQSFNHSEGYIEPERDPISQTIIGFDYIYQYKDHLGNVRLSYSDADNNGTIAQSEIIEESNYYPFGLKQKGYNNIVTSTNIAQKFKFNGKEFEESLGYNMYEMDMRSYDPTIARWTSIDPVTHHSMSTYNAFDNNPVYWADPSGADSQYSDKVAWIIGVGNDMYETTTTQTLKNKLTTMYSDGSSYTSTLSSESKDVHTVTHQAGEDISNEMKVALGTIISNVVDVVNEIHDRKAYNAALKSVSNDQNFIKENIKLWYDGIDISQISYDIKNYLKWWSLDPALGASFDLDPKTMKVVKGSIHYTIGKSTYLTISKNATNLRLRNGNGRIGDNPNTPNVVDHFNDNIITTTYPYGMHFTGGFISWRTNEARQNYLDFWKNRIEFHKNEISKK